MRSHFSRVKGIALVAVRRRNAGRAKPEIPLTSPFIDSVIDGFRERDGETASFADFAFQFDGTVHPLDKLHGDEESQPGSGAEC